MTRSTPLSNAVIMSRLMPDAVLIHDGGHVELIANAAEQALVIEAFLRGCARPQGG